MHKFGKNKAAIKGSVDTIDSLGTLESPHVQYCTVDWKTSIFRQTLYIIYLPELVAKRRSHVHVYSSLIGLLNKITATD